MIEGGFLPGLPVDRIRAAYMAAPGNEIESGKFASPESSAALVANAFGLFLERPELLPSLPGTSALGWPAHSVGLEVIVRFPWSGGRHPCLDVLVVTGKGLIGVESKRYEPFRSKNRGELSEAYWRPVWGDAMRGYESVRDRLHNGDDCFARLDAAQLVKHAFGLRTATRTEARFIGLRPILFYLYAEPISWPDGRSVSANDLLQHRKEIASFREAVAGDEVEFLPCSYRCLLSAWAVGGSDVVASHASAITMHFAL